MKFILASGFIGGLVNFFLGWLLYGYLFQNHFPSTGNENIGLIFFGCLVYGHIVSFCFSKSGPVTNYRKGIKYGAILGLLISLYMNIFGNVSATTINTNLIILDIAIMTLISAFVGMMVAVTNRKIQ